jgi:hypothetical protein
MILSIFLSFLFAGDADSTVNKHLQKTHQRQDYLRKRAEIMSETMQLEQPLRKGEVEDGTYGVVKEAPEEAFPDYTQPSKVYKPNPLESSTESVHRNKQLKQYEQNLQKEYMRQYIKNAEQDDVKVNINDDKVVDDYKQNNRPRSNTTRSISGQN